MEKSILKQAVTLKINRSSLAYQLLEGLRGKGAPCFWHRGEDGYIFSFMADEEILNFINIFIADEAERI